MGLLWACCVGAVKQERSSGGRQEQAREPGSGLVGTCRRRRLNGGGSYGTAVSTRIAGAYCLHATAPVTNALTSYIAASRTIPACSRHAPPPPPACTGAGPNRRPDLAAAARVPGDPLQRGGAGAGLLQGLVSAEGCGGEALPVRGCGGCRWTGLQAAAPCPAWLCSDGMGRCSGGCGCGCGCGGGAGAASRGGGVTATATATATAAAMRAPAVDRLHRLWGQRLGWGSSAARTPHGKGRMRGLSSRFGPQHTASHGPPRQAALATPARRPVIWWAEHERAQALCLRLPVLTTRLALTAGCSHPMPPQPSRPPPISTHSFYNPWESRTDANVDLVYFTLAHLRRGAGGGIQIPKGTQEERWGHRRAGRVGGVGAGWLDAVSGTTRGGGRCGAMRRVRCC